MLSSRQNNTLIAHLKGLPWLNRRMSEVAAQELNLQERSMKCKMSLAMTAPWPAYLSGAINYRHLTERRGLHHHRSFSPSLDLPMYSPACTCSASRGVCNEGAMMMEHQCHLECIAALPLSNSRHALRQFLYPHNSVDAVLQAQHALYTHKKPQSIAFRQSIASHSTSRILIGGGRNEELKRFLQVKR